MNRLVILLAVVLVGCNDDSPSPNDGVYRDTGSGGVRFDYTYTYDYDQYSTTGLVLKKYMPGSYSYITFEEMEDIYENVEVCVVDNNTPGPYLSFIDFQHFGLAGGWGVYAAATMDVYIRNEEEPVIRNSISDRATVKHEFVHHILYMNGQDHSHANPAFAQCDALGTKTCNGVPCE